jgi:PAS domain S-box-containing protein
MGTPGEQLVDLKALLGSMTDLVFVFDREGRWLWAAEPLVARGDNGRANADVVIGHTLHEILPGDVADSLLETIHSALETQETQYTEYPVNWLGGKLWFLAAVSPMPNDNVVWVARNITARKQEEERLAAEVQHRTRDLETLLDVSRTVASTLDLRDVLSRLLDQAKILIPYNGASVNLLEGDELVVLDARAPQNDYKIGARFPMRRSIRPGSNNMWDRLTRGEAVIIKDMSDDSEPMAVAYKRGTSAAGHGAVEALNRIRSWMCVPLMHQSDVLGTLSMSRPEPDFFTEEHARLAMAVAGQAAVAIKNARLFEQTEERTRELSVLLDVSRELTASRQLRDLARAMLVQIKRVIDYTGGSALAIESDSIRFIQSMGPDGIEEEQEGLRLPLDLGMELARRVLNSEAVIIDDVRGEGTLALDYRNILGGSLEAPAYRYIRSWMAIPLHLEGRVIGLISMSKDVPGYFTEHHVELATAIARHAAVAAENANLLEQRERRTNELAALFEISRALSSTIEFQPLLELILDHIQSVVPYDGAGITLIDGGYMQQLAVRRPQKYRDMGQTSNVQLTEVGFGSYWETLSRGIPLIIADVWDDSPEAVHYRKEWGGDLRGTPVEYVRSFMCVPLMIRDTLIGTIAVARQETDYFKSSHAELIETIAAPAAAAIENARLFEQTQRRTRELSALLAVSKAAVSTNSLSEIFRVILDELSGIIDHSGSAIVLREGDHLVVVDARGLSGDASDIGGRIPISGTEIWRSISLGEPVIIGDVHGNEPMAVSYVESMRRIGVPDSALSAIRSWMGVPLILGSEVIGILTLSWTEPDHFTNEHAGLASVFANQAAAAVNNARLFNATEQRAKEMEALFRSDERIFRSLDLEDVLNALVDVAVDLLGAEKSLVMTWNFEEQRLAPRAFRNFSAESIAFMESPEGMLSPASHPTEMTVEFESTDSVQGPWHDRLVAEGIHHYAEIPLISASGVILGTFSVTYSADRTLKETDKRMLLALAERAVMAIENADLHARSYSQGRQLAAIEERQRLARELHDSVSQALYGIALGARTARTVLDREPAKAIEPVEYVLSLAEAGLAEMRALIFELRPESLESEGIVAALDKQIAAAGARYQIAIESDLCEEPDISLERKEVLYRIAQEALHNTVKHARAQHVSVRLAQEDGHVNLRVSDDGGGFEPEGDFPGHLGLKSMRERAANTGGSLRIESAPGKGTSITASVPAWA